MHLTEYDSFLVCTELGLLMKSCIDQGHLLPDDVMSRLILSNLRDMDNSSWLLDGKTLIKPSAYKHYTPRLYVIWLRH